MKSVLIIVATIVTLVLAEPDFLALFKGEKDDNCKDSDPEYCAEAASLGFCTSKKHSREMETKCRKSCHMCCGDRNKSMCKKYKKEYKNFCNSTSITVEELRMVCGETCHLCKDDLAESKFNILFQRP